MALAVRNTSQPCSIGGQPTSVYEWREDAWRSPKAQRDLVDAAVQLCVSTVHVDLTAAAVADVGERQDLIDDLLALVAMAERSDIRIAGLAGDPWWPTPEGLVDASAVLDLVADVNLRLAPGTSVDSLHIDAEPWSLTEWSSRREQWSIDFVSFIEHVVAHRDRLPGEKVQLAFLVPYWFDGTNGEAPLIEIDGRTASPFAHLVDADHGGVSYVVMAYRDRALGEGGIVDLIADEMASDVPIVLAIETVGVEPASITFADDGFELLDVQLRLVHEAQEAGGRPLSGVVINDLAGLRQLAAAVRE